MSVMNIIFSNRLFFTIQSGY